MFCALAREPYGVLASVDGWEPFWVDCGYGALTVLELTALILNEFLRLFSVWLPRDDGGSSLMFSGRLVDPALRVADAIPNQARVFVRI